MKKNACIFAGRVVWKILIIFLLFAYVIPTVSLSIMPCSAQITAIYLDSKETLSSQIQQQINQSDTILITLRTYGTEKASINLDENGLKLISERFVNLPDLNESIKQHELYGRSYEFRLNALKEGNFKILLSTDSGKSFEISLKVKSSIGYKVYAESSTDTHVTGILKLLVLLVDFPDFKANYGTSTPEFYTNLLFGEGKRSMYDYYLENSLGKLKVEGEVYSSWITAPSPYSYYEGHYRGMGFYPNNSQKLLEDILEKIDSKVDFTKYDGNNDGEVDGIILIYAGQKADARNPNRIYPHQWSIKSQRRDGKYITNYSILPEYRNKPGDTTIGPFCHEFGHMIGAIDLYDLDGLVYASYDGEKSYGIGKWSVMAYGTWGTKDVYGDSPTHFDAWHKIKFGWIEPIVIKESIENVTLPAIESEEGKVYKIISPSNPKEYFLVENRQKIGFDVSLPGSGLLIYHVDDSMSSNNYAWYPEKGSISKNHYLISVVQADNKWDLEKNKNIGDAYDPFPGKGNYTSFSKEQFPLVNYYSGEELNFEIKNIESNDNFVKLDFLVKSEEENLH